MRDEQGTVRAWSANGRQSQGEDDQQNGRWKRDVHLLGDDYGAFGTTRGRTTTSPLLVRTRIDGDSVLPGGEGRFRNSRSFELAAGSASSWRARSVLSAFMIGPVPRFDAKVVPNSGASKAAAANCPTSCPALPGGQILVRQTFANAPRGKLALAAASGRRASRPWRRTRVARSRSIAEPLQRHEPHVAGWSR